MHSLQYVFPRWVRLGATLAVVAASVSAQDAQLGPPPKAPWPVVQEALLPPALQAAAISPAWLNPWRRALVSGFYRNVYLPSENNISLGWTGDGATCTPGTTLQTYRDAVAQRLAWFRSMAGVPPGVALDPINNAKDQQAALMMSVNRAVNHFPPASWTCYTSDGAAAAGQANLCYSTGASYLRGDPGCIELYMNDFGTNNTAVGHRRWVLYPQTQTMGTGDVPATGTYYSANALWAWDSNFGGPRPATRDVFVAWPPKGYVPAALVFGRWSFSYPGADFSTASANMLCNGANLPLTQQPVANGYGENTLVWETAGCSPSGGVDAIAEVAISGVSIGGTPQDFAYTVRIFDPNTVIADRIGIQRQGHWQLDVNGDGTVSRDFFLGWAGATTVTGDWNGDGRTKAGVYSGGFWFLDYDGNGVWDGGAVDKQIGWGWPGATPIVGDWNGDGKTEIGVYSGGFWFLDYNGDFLWDGDVVDKQVGWGWSGVTPFVGDWNGDGKTKIGVYSNGFWFLDYDGNYTWDGGAVDKFAGWGWAGTTPVVGDWNGDGKTKIGVYAGGYWYVDYDGNYSWDGGTLDKIWVLGWTGTTPVIGDWSGDGKDKAGAFINGYWYLDYNGNGAWDGAVTDRIYSFGQAGDTAVVGRW